MYSALILLLLFVTPGACGDAGEALVTLGALPVAQYLVIVARERCGSTHLGAVLGQHPCVLFGDEVLSLHEMDPLQLVYLTRFTYEDMMQNISGFLDAAHSLVSCPSSCRQHCTIVLKMFDGHLSGNLTAQRSVLAHPGVRVAVLERDAEHIICSLNKGHSLVKDFAHTPLERAKLYGETLEQQRERTRICLEGLNSSETLDILNDTYPHFREHHAHWYATVRNTLADLNKAFITVPFGSSTVGCYFYTELLPMLYAFMGQRKRVRIRDSSVPACPVKA